MVGMTTFDIRLLAIVRRRAWCIRYNATAVVAATRGIVRLLVVVDIGSSNDGDVKLLMLMAGDRENG